MRSIQMSGVIHMQRCAREHAVFPFLAPVVLSCFGFVMNKRAQVDVCLRLHED